MDAIEFINEKARMCNVVIKANGLCNNCPLYDIKDCNLDDLVNNGNVEKAVEIVEKWSAEHPRKTRQSIFLQQYPEVPLTYDGVINIKPCQMINHYAYEDGCDFDNHINCMKCKEKYWLKEIKEGLKK